MRGIKQKEENKTAKNELHVFATCVCKKISHEREKNKQKKEKKMSYTQEIVITALCCIGLIRFICWFAPRKIFANVSLVSLRTSTNAVKKFIYTVEGLADLGVVLITWGVIQNDEIMINRGWALVLIPMIILTALAVYAVWKRS